MPTKPKTAGKQPQKANSTSFKKGVSGNPAGPRPTEMRFSTRLEWALRASVPDWKDKGYQQEIDRLDEIVERTILLARSGDMQAINAVADRLDGKPKQSTELSGELKVVTPILSGLSTLPADLSTPDAV